MYRSKHDPKKVARERQIDRAWRFTYAYQQTGNKEYSKIRCPRPLTLTLDRGTLPEINAAMNCKTWRCLPCAVVKGHQYSLKVAHWLAEQIMSGNRPAFIVLTFHYDPEQMKSDNPKWVNPHTGEMYNAVWFRKRLSSFVRYLRTAHRVDQYIAMPEPHETGSPHINLLVDNFAGNLADCSRKWCERTGNLVALDHLSRGQFTACKIELLDRGFQSILQASGYVAKYTTKDAAEGSGDFVREVFARRLNRSRGVHWCPHCFPESLRESQAHCPSGTTDPLPTVPPAVRPQRATVRSWRMGDLRLYGHHELGNAPPPPELCPIGKALKDQRQIAAARRKLRSPNKQEAPRWPATLRVHPSSTSIPPGALLTADALEPVGGLIAHGGVTLTVAGPDSIAATARGTDHANANRNKDGQPCLSQNHPTGSSE